MSICFYNVHEHTLCDTLNHQLDEKFASFNISTLCLKETEVVTIFILLEVICYSGFNQMTQFIICNITCSVNFGVVFPLFGIPCHLSCCFFLWYSDEVQHHHFVNYSIQTLKPYHDIETVAVRQCANFRTASTTEKFEVSQSPILTSLPILNKSILYREIWTSKAHTSVYVSSLIL